MNTIVLRQHVPLQKIISLNLFVKNWKKIYAIFFVSFVFLLISYIYSVNKLTEGTYLIKNYNKELATLSEENRILETNFAQTGFLGSMQEKAHELSFEKTGPILYVQMTGNSLADAK